MIDLVSAMLIFTGVAVFFLFIHMMMGEVHPSGPP